MMKKGTEMATIDVNLVTLATEDGEIGLTTANKIGVTPSIETVDAVKLVIKGNLIAQKPAVNTLTGNAITLTDNVFTPEVALIIQGGTIKFSEEPGHETEVIGYKPPVVGSNDKGETFKLCAYSAIYDASGAIVKYEKITYPNCQGVPVALSSEDGVFRAPEYTINSAPKTGEAPYEINYVTALPTFGA